MSDDVLHELQDQNETLVDIDQTLDDIKTNLNDLLTYVIYQSNDLNITNDLIIACLNLLAGFLIGYTAVRGFFDPWK